MVREKEVHVEAKISRNFNTVTTGIVYHLDYGDKPHEIMRKGHDECRKLCLEKLKEITK